MTRRQIVRLEMLRRVRDFGTLHQAQFPDGSPGRNAFDAVAAALDGLGTNHKAKMAAAQEGFRAKKQGRRALVGELENIARAAKFIARTTPGFDDGFRLPERRNDQVFITGAKLFLERAQPQEAQFIAFGLPPTFLQTLRTHLQAFESAIAACEDGSRDSAAAQAAIEAAIRAGMDGVIRLDIIVANHFKGDVATLASWERDRQLRTAYPQRSAPEAPANPTTGSNPPAPTPAPKPRSAEPAPPPLTVPLAGAFYSALRGDPHVGPMEPVVTEIPATTTTSINTTTSASEPTLKEVA